MIVLDAAAADITLPLSAVISIASALLTIGGTYAAVRSRLAAIDEKIGKVDDKASGAAADVNIEKLERIRLEGKLLLVEKSVRDLEVAQDRVVTLAEFDTRTKAQDAMLQRIDRRLDAGARTPSQAMRATDMRREPSDPPDDVPPMRRRLPSVRGAE